jgi:hypothetical protein
MNDETIHNDEMNKPDNEDSISAKTKLGQEEKEAVFAKMPRQRSKKVISEEEKKEARLKLDLVKSEIEKSIADYSKKMTQNRRPALFSKLLTTGLSSAVTILLGFNVGEDAHVIKVMNNVALIISAMMTVLSVWVTFFDHNELWVQYSKTINDLNLLMQDLNFMQTGNDNLSVEDVEQIQDRYRTTIFEVFQFVHKIRSEEPKAMILPIRK